MENSIADDDVISFDWEINAFTKDKTNIRHRTEFAFSSFYSFQIWIDAYYMSTWSNL